MSQQKPETLKFEAGGPTAEQFEAMKAKYRSLLIEFFSERGRPLAVPHTEVNAMIARAVLEKLNTPENRKMIAEKIKTAGENGVTEFGLNEVDGYIVPVGKIFSGFQGELQLVVMVKTGEVNIGRQIGGYSVEIPKSGQDLEQMLRVAALEKKILTIIEKEKPIWGEPEAFVLGVDSQFLHLQVLEMLPAR